MTPFYQLGRIGVKICGITSQRQAEDIIAAGADAIGFNFWPKSKRYISIQHAKWAADLTGAMRVAVVVNATDDELDQIVQCGLVDAIQLHGDETPERCEQVVQMGLPVIKALQVRDESVLDWIPAYRSAQAVLLDSYNPGQYGGEGRTFPWHLGSLAVRRFQDLPVILAGGLVPENVGEAVSGVYPAAVDVASGVETSPGVKDLEKVSQFIQQVHMAESSLS
ncbi:MAG: phosphoribosylanthranilate isomerase [Verrucomicrobiaceae bacterium]|nr:phosphoribosylanthranilate isomerase [Verrucomicrobiaceae bacterium]